MPENKDSQTEGSDKLAIFNREWERCSIHSKTYPVGAQCPDCEKLKGKTK